MTAATFSTITSIVGTFVSAITSAGTSLITWLTSPGNEIALVPFFLFVTVAIVGAVKSLIKGI